MDELTGGGDVGVCTAHASTRFGPVRQEAERTVKSYLLQEAEAASREANMAWCVRHGVAG